MFRLASPVKILYGMSISLVLRGGRDIDVLYRTRSDVAGLSVIDFEIFVKKKTPIHPLENKIQSHIKFEKPRIYNFYQDIQQQN